MVFKRIGKQGIWSHIYFKYLLSYDDSYYKISWFELYFIKMVYIDKNCLIPDISYVLFEIKKISKHYLLKTFCFVYI